MPHTTGPWKVSRLGPGWYINSPHGLIGQLTAQPGDAALIGSAPDLLAACEVVLEFLEQDYDPPEDIIAAVRAAIQKASGECPTTE